MNDLESTGPSVAEVKATPLTTEQAQLSDARKNLLGALPDAFNKDYKDLLKGPDVQAAQGYRLEANAGLGMKVVVALVRNLHANLEIGNDGPGARFTISCTPADRNTSSWAKPWCTR